MERNTIAALADFSAGCFFASLLASCALLYMVRRRSGVHCVATCLFGWLALMNMVLFVLFYVRNFLGAQLTPITNLYQATCIPMCVCLLYELGHPGSITRRAFWLQVAASLLLCVLYAVTLNHTLYIIALVGQACYGLVGMLWSGYGLYRYNRSIRQWSSYTEGIEVGWVFRILVSFMVLYVVWTLASYNGGKWATAFYNFSCSLIFASIAWCMRKHEVVVPGIAEPEEDCPVIDEEGAPQEFHFAEALHKAFDDERIYLNPRLTINLLAERLGTNRTYLSTYINKQLNVSFFEYVNRYRVVYAKGLLAQPDCTVEAAVRLSGFNSLSAFRRAFISETGMTPGQFRRELQGEGQPDAD